MPSTSPATTSSPTCGAPPSTGSEAELGREPGRGRPRRPRGRPRRRNRRVRRGRPATQPPAARRGRPRGARASRRASPDVEQRAEVAVADVVRDVLALEHADHDRVGAGARRGSSVVAARPSRGTLPVPRLRRRPSGARRSATTIDGTAGNPGDADTDAKDRDPVRCPNADRQARRRPLEPRRDRARRRPRSRLRSSARRSPAEVQHVVMGQVLQAGQGQIPSRQAQIKAGIPREVLLGDDQQGLRLRDSRCRAARHGNPRRRP